MQFANDRKTLARFQFQCRFSSNDAIFKLCCTGMGKERNSPAIFVRVPRKFVGDLRDGTGIPTLSRDNRPSLVLFTSVFRQCFEKLWFQISSSFIIVFFLSIILNFVRLGNYDLKNPTKEPHQKFKHLLQCYSKFCSFTHEYGMWVKCCYRRLEKKF